MINKTTESDRNPGQLDVQYGQKQCSPHYMILNNRRYLFLDVTSNIGMKMKYMISATLFAIPILFYFAIGPTLFPSEAVFAQSINSINNSSSSNTISTEQIVNSTSPGQPVVLRGIVSSEDYKGESVNSNDSLYGAVLLPNRPDGSIYKGILTFTATKPVEVGFAHRLHIDNSTLSKLDKEQFGSLYAVHPLDQGEKGTPGQLSTLSIVVPDYGTAPPYFSGSIPFVGDGVFLQTTNDEPFIAEYELYADIVQPIGVVDLSIPNETSLNSTNSSIPAS